MSTPSQLCLRWNETRETWRHGSEPIATRRYEIAVIPDDTTAREFVVRHHYSRSYVAARRRFGLYRGAELQGVAVFSQPVQERALAPLGPVASAGIELGRLVLLDQVPGNGESWFVGRCFELLRAEGFEGVLSFSDPMPRPRADGGFAHPGHVGIVYQSLNARYAGRGTARSLRLLPDGRAVNARALQKIRSGYERGGTTLIADLEAAGAAPFDSTDPTGWLRTWLPKVTRAFAHPGNHRYLFGLTHAARRAMPPNHRSYPEPLGGRAAPRYGRRVSKEDNLHPGERIHYASRTSEN